MLQLRIDVYSQSLLLYILHLVAKSHAPGANAPKQLSSVCKGKHWISLNQYMSVILQKDCPFQWYLCNNKIFQKLIEGEMLL